MTQQTDITAPRVATGSAGNRSSGELQLISFKLEDEEFGVEISRIKEILKVPEITPVPRAPDYLLGMMNLRGLILPVMDLKKRLGQGEAHVSHKTRILVLQLNDQLYGVMVDEVSEVRRLDKSAIEPPPKVTRGIDKYFLEGVAKLPGHQLLIMLLNLQEVLNIELVREKKAVTESVGTAVEVSTQKKEQVEEEHLAVFSLGEEEFGIDIAVVQEILKVGEIATVPNVPGYVKGIANIRDTVLPVIDLRKLVGMPDLQQAHHETVDLLKQGHLAWVENLKETLFKDKTFTGSTDPQQCRLGKLLEYNKTHDIEFGDMYRKFKPPHDALHLTGRDVLNLMRSQPDAAKELFLQQVEPLLEELLELLNHLQEWFDKRTRREQRILVVTIATTTIGLLVDRVLEVVRLPKDIIDTTPAILTSYGKEIKGIAKMNKGTRLILLMEQNALLSAEEMKTISDIGESQARKQEKEEEIEIIERQFVVFSVLGEEFGITIDKVQEIFKPQQITPVPKAPEFISGVTNLRGSIIPVVDVRERFHVTGENGSGTTSHGKNRDSGRILVIYIKDTIVGLLVDDVREVLRVATNKIEPAPSLVVSNVDTGYLEGIAKLEDGQRIILLLDTGEIMTSKEFIKLSAFKKDHLDKPSTDPEPQSKEKPKKRTPEPKKAKSGKNKETTKKKTSKEK